MKSFTDNQKKAIRQLERAFAVCAKANLVMCGIDDNLHVAKYNQRFKDASMKSSACEAILDTGNCDLDAHDLVKASIYIDSGGA